jgi:hypothetical protein
LNILLRINFCGVLTVLCSEIRHCAKRQNVVQKASYTHLLYNALRLHRSCTKFSLRSPFVQLWFFKIPKKNPRFAPFFFGTSPSRSALATILEATKTDAKLSKNMATGSFKTISNKTIWTVPLYSLLCMYFFGSIMMTHFVIYPHFDKVHDNFQNYMGVFNYKMIFFCYLPSILMIVSSILLWFNCPKVFPRWTVLTSIILGLISVATTFFTIIPLHKALQTSGFNTTAYEHLLSISLTFQIIPILFQILIVVWLLNIYLKDTKPFARWLFIIICSLNFYTQATGWTESFVAYPMWAEVSQSNWLTFRAGVQSHIFLFIFLIPGFFPMLLMPFLFWFRPKGIPKFYVTIYVYLPPARIVHKKKTYKVRETH